MSVGVGMKLGYRRPPSSSSSSSHLRVRGVLMHGHVGLAVEFGCWLG